MRVTACLPAPPFTPRCIVFALLAACLCVQARATIDPAGRQCGGGGGGGCGPQASRAPCHSSLRLKGQRSSMTRGPAIAPRRVQSSDSEEAEQEQQPQPSPTGSRNQCFHCSQQGHWANDCPQRSPSATTASGWGTGRDCPSARDDAARPVARCIRGAALLQDEEEQAQRQSEGAGGSTASCHRPAAPRTRHTLGLPALSAPC